MSKKLSSKEIVGHEKVAKEERKSRGATVPIWERLLEIGEVMKMVNISKSQIYQLMHDKAFPAPLKLGRASRWKLSSILEWIGSCPSA
ncbi:MAG: AlpA family phage regulatory protein [Betaproteobacteria bacterium]|nr:AlpA family phage regulatory protein [Betaproteobacteria bacterium]